MSERASPELQSFYVRLYFDEDVSVSIAENLRRRGFDVLCTREASMLCKNDDEQMDFAIAERRAFVTHNRAHFERKHRELLEQASSHPGIIIARRRKRDEETVARLLTLLDSVTAEEMRDQLRYL